MEATINYGGQEILGAARVEGPIVVIEGMRRRLRRSRPRLWFARQNTAGRVLEIGDKLPSSGLPERRVSRSMIPSRFQRPPDAGFVLIKC